MAIESRLVSQDDRERPEPRRGLQLRHPQARRRVRRRHQQAARDDLRRARQGPPQRGPDRDRPGVPRRRGRRARRDAPRRRAIPTSGTSRACRRAARRWASTGDGHLGGRAVGARQPRGDRRAPPRARRRAARGQGGRGRRGRLGDGRAPRPAPDDRLAVGRAPDRARRHAARHRPARLRPAGPAQRVPARGVPALRGAARPDPPRGRVDDLPGHRHPPAGARHRGSPTRRSPRRWPRGAAAAHRRQRRERRRPSARAARVAGRGCRGGRRLGRRCAADRRAAGPATDPRIARRRAGRERRRCVGRRAEARVHPERRADRPERSVLVRLGRRSTRSATAADRRRSPLDRRPWPRSLGRSCATWPGWSSRAASALVALAGLRQLPDLGAGPARRPAPGRRDRRPRRRPVRRPAVAGLRGPARPRGRRCTTPASRRTSS